MTGARNVVLAGPMGAGKTTVARLVAQWLGRQFVDTDALVGEAAGMSVAELFASQGEATFRRLEAEAVQAVCERTGLVVAVGGGAVCDPDSAARLSAACHVVVLDADPVELAERVRGGQRAGQRPLLDGAGDVVGRLAELQREREPAYAAVADLRVTTSGRPPEAVAAEIAAWLEERQ